MNYFKLAMYVFNKHKLEFIKIAVKRQNLKQKLVIDRHNGKKLNRAEIAKLEAEMKADIERINKLIKGFINGN